MDQVLGSKISVWLPQSYFSGCALATCSLCVVSLCGYTPLPLEMGAGVLRHPAIAKPSHVKELSLLNAVFSILNEAPWWMPGLPEPCNYCFKSSLQLGFLDSAGQDHRTGLIILAIFQSPAATENVMGMCQWTVHSDWGYSLQSWMTVSVLFGPALPLAWISIFKPVYVTDGYQDSEVETQTVETQQLSTCCKTEEGIHWEVEDVCNNFFCRIWPSSISKCRRGAFFDFFLIRVVHITKFTPLKCTISGF